MPSSLAWRLTLGPAIIAALAGICWLDARAERPGTFLFPLAIFAGGLAAGEMAELFRRRGPAPESWVVYAATLIVPLAWTPEVYLWQWRSGHTERLGWTAVGLAGAVFIAFLAEMKRYVQPGESIVRIGLAIFAAAYAGGLLTFLFALRLFGGSAVGLAALGSCIAIVKLGDIGAFAVGRRIGRHKMSPVISPGKTWEGAAGALLFGAVAAWVIFRLALPAWIGSGTPVTAHMNAIVFGVLLAGAGMLGDLAESLLKRDAGVKDSSTWLPGFGGVLDLLDSLLFAGPVAYLAWAWGLVGV